MGTWPAEVRGEAPDDVRLGAGAKLAGTLLVLLLSVLFVGGTWKGNDDWWPFGPWRMFATSTAPTGGVAVLAIEVRTGPPRSDPPDALGSVSGVARSWQPASINLNSVGLNRAEVEGRVPQMLADPAMLGTLAATHARLRPHDPRWTGVRVVRVVTVIDNRRPTGEERRTVLAEWDAAP